MYLDVVNILSYGDDGFLKVSEFYADVTARSVFCDEAVSNSVANEIASAEFASQ